MDPALPIVALSLVLGAIIAFLFFNAYFRKRQSEVRSIAKPNPDPNPNPISEPLPKKPLSKPHSTDKVASNSQLLLLVSVLCLLRFSKCGFFYGFRIKTSDTIRWIWILWRAMVMRWQGYASRPMDAIWQQVLFLLKINSSIFVAMLCSILLCLLFSSGVRSARS